MALPPIERQQAVLTILQGLQGTEPLKQLFWSELNYSRVNTPLSRRGWNATAADSLAADPILFATGGDGFHIIHSRLSADKLLLGQERPIVLQLLIDHPYALFVFSNHALNRWHFLNVKFDDEITKRRVFRRITVGPEERLRTASERIAMLDLESVSADLFGLSPLAIQTRHDEAFDVEPVTQEFFHEYARIFSQVEEQVEGIRDAERKRLFTQRLFNRLMFIAFIQKKGWLKFGREGDYLDGLWRDFKRSDKANRNFYRDRLKLLFFAGLNTPNEVNIISINRGGFLKELIGQVPYLNGGLFEEDDDDQNTRIVVPDECIAAILDKLFNRFNFTVTESTPLDIEVAVDPEMLGKIFEELVTGRHETGSYYTPKPVVSFMCKEGLKGYLRSCLPSESEAAIGKFVEEHDPASLTDPEAVLEALRTIKVCDPACGSGAYLLGMLHELIDLRTCLFATRQLDAISTYQRKLEVIQTNLYGVDIDEFAVNVARLRLWLSLAVEFEGETPPPLPNLDYKVEAGDSLTAPDPSGGEALHFRKPLIEKFLKAKTEYLTAHGSHKLELQKEIQKLLETIASWTHRGEKVSGFDWPVEFAEVFTRGGFDVVMANPPYVRMELFKEIKPVLRGNFPHVHAERADLYCYFYARALELLRSSGMLVFISSDKWLRAYYGANLRKTVANSCRILSITDFGELPVFQSGSTFPMIFVAEKRASQQDFVFTQVKSLDPPYPDVLSIIRQVGQTLPPTAIRGPDWNLQDTVLVSMMRKMEAAGMSLSQHVGGKMYRGVVTGYDKAFIIEGTLAAKLRKASAECAKLIMPLIVGDDVRKWRVNFRDRWLIFVDQGVKTRGLGPILNHLRHHREGLENRATEQEWYELQQPNARYVPVYAGPKIVYPEIAKESRFTLDENGFYPLKTIFSIPSTDLYLLGVLNSAAAWF